MTHERDNFVDKHRSRIADRRLNSLVLEELEAEEVHLKQVDV